MPGKRAQRFLTATEDGRLVEESLPVEKGYAVDDKSKEAWLVLRGAQLLQQGTNKLFEIVCERSYAPFNFTKMAFSSDHVTLAAIAREALSQAKAEAIRQQKKDRQWEIFKFVAIVLVIGLVVVVLSGMFMSGKLHFSVPDFGGMF